MLIRFITNKGENNEKKCTKKYHKYCYDHSVNGMPFF